MQESAVNEEKAGPLRRMQDKESEKNKRKNGDNPKVCIVGSPNVGKSVLFGRLCDKYVTVSNYPGTTVEVTRGSLISEGKRVEVIDTPGMYSFNAVTKEEEVAKDIIINETPGCIVHVIDSMNLERMLPLTLQIIETGLPVILVLNIMDEAEKKGLKIDTEALSKEIGVPVFPAVSLSGKGMDEIRSAVNDIIKNKSPGVGKVPVYYSSDIEYLLNRIVEKSGSVMQLNGVSDRFKALRIINKDPVIMNRLRGVDSGAEDYIHDDISGSFSQESEIEYEIAVKLREKSVAIAKRVVSGSSEGEGIREKISRAMMNPVTGIPILFLILYFGLYKFVGVFGAGTVVDFIEGRVFEDVINPRVTLLFERMIPWTVLQDLFVGEFGVITLGLRYAVALILPIVTFFFIVFSVIEDTGYLPRLAMLIDRVFKKIGLSGRAVIPMVLGLGCDTMATMVTRTLSTRRERFISTVLLSLTVPCSAQIGVIFAVMQDKPISIIIWGGTVALIFLIVGSLSAKMLPGEKPSFHMEIPPLRLPKISNVLIKTYSRVKWYFREVLPLFLGASLLIWLGNLTKLFDLALSILSKPVKLIGLPEEAAKVFLFGFFRRDYGAAGLYDLQKQGMLDGVQLVVASVALTLFLPCIAQFLMNLKERGVVTGLAISGFILVFSFFAAYLLNLILSGLGVMI